MATTRLPVRMREELKGRVGTRAVPGVCLYSSRSPADRNFSRASGFVTPENFPESA